MLCPEVFFSYISLVFSHQNSRYAESKWINLPTTFPHGYHGWYLGKGLAVKTIDCESLFLHSNSSVNGLAASIWLNNFTSLGLLCMFGISGGIFWLQRTEKWSKSSLIKKKEIFSCNESNHQHPPGSITLLLMTQQFSWFPFTGVIFKL